MEEFVKITEEFLNNDTEYEKYLVENVAEHRKKLINKFDLWLLDAIKDCESPIEQLLAMELDRIQLTSVNIYNPFIEIIGIEKQVEIECNKEKYRVDFLIPVLYKNQCGKMFIIECDGYEFHQKTKEQVEKDNERHRKMQKAGYEIIRFSGTEIHHNAFKCACEIRNIILSKCKYIEGNEYE